MADYLSEEEQLERLKNWWSENGRSVVAAVVLACGGVAGWRWYDAERTEDRQAASAAYESYRAAEGDAREALALNLASEYGETSYATFSLLHRAKEAIDAGDAEAGLAILKQITEMDTHPLLRDIARIRLARLQAEDDAEAALVVLAEVQSQGFRTQVLELKGDIHRLQGDQVLAHEAYLEAAEEVGEGARRPILDIKVDDTAPVQDQVEDTAPAQDQ